MDSTTDCTSRKAARKAAALRKLRAGAIAAREKVEIVSRHIQEHPLPDDADEAVVELNKRLDETAKKFGLQLLSGSDWSECGEDHPLPEN